MEDKKFTIIIVLATLLILGGGVYFALNVGGKAVVEENSKAEVSVENTSHDWGEIGINNGNAEAEFEIKNSGNGDLKLFNVATSCACTTAQLFYEEEASPVYGMHTSSSYVMNIPPEKSARLKVIFDPAFHGPSGVGPITRQINIQTNDSDNEEISFMLSANVTK